MYGCRQEDNLPVLLGWCSQGTVSGLYLGAVFFSTADATVIGAQASILALEAENARVLFQFSPGWSFTHGSFEGVMQLSGISNAAEGSFAGVGQFSLFHNQAGEFFGLVQLSSVRNRVDRRFVGLLQAGAWNSARAFTGGFEIGVYNDISEQLPQDTHDNVGIQIGLANHTDRLLGGQLGFLNYNDWETYRLVGLQLGFVNVTGELRGLQLGPGGNRANSLRGLELGLLNLVEAGTSNGGAQLGVFWNGAPELSGLQLGLVNTIRGSKDGDMHGVQAGAINTATRFTGLQIGVINYAGELNGVQLGGLNIMRTPFRILPIANFH